MKTAIITMQRDTQRYVREWAAFHKSTGWDHIYVIDHDSGIVARHEYEELLRVGLIDHLETATWSPGEPNLHPKAVNMGLRVAIQNGIDWVAVVDDDEFIEPVGRDSVRYLLIRARHFDLITMNWRWMGSGEDDGRPVLERVIRASESSNPLNRWVKPIWRPAAFGQSFSIHCPGFPIQGYPVIGVHDMDELWPTLPNESLTATPSFNSLALRHYKFRSHAEFAKQARRPYPGDPGRLSREFAYDPSLDAVEDRWAERYLPAMRELLRKSTPAQSPASNPE